MDEQQLVRTQQQDGIAVVTICHPPANTLSPACIAQLRAVFRQLADDRRVKAVILTGEGRFFAAGADIKQFVPALGDEERARQLAQDGQALCSEVEQMVKPVLAAINGAALGGGFELALGCHYRIAADHVTVGLPEVKLGLIPGFGGTQRLRQLTSTAAAIRMILTGASLGAEEALRNGVVQQVVPAEALMETAIATARSFVEDNSMDSVARAIACIVQGVGEPLEQGLERERRMFAELFATANAKEGIQAFVEKRKPRFSDESDEA